MLTPRSLTAASGDDQRLVARLLAKRHLDPATGCWEWQGRRDRWGYGRITVAHRRYAVHRLSAAVFLGFDPARTLQIRPPCHNPPCFRPDHLRPGIHHENTLDRRQRVAARTTDYRAS